MMMMTLILTFLRRSPKVKLIMPSDSGSMSSYWSSIVVTIALSRTETLFSSKCTFLQNGGRPPYWNGYICRYEKTHFVYTLYEVIFMKFQAIHDGFSIFNKFRAKMLHLLHPIPFDPSSFIPLLK